MKTNNTYVKLILLSGIFVLISCEDFVEIDTPDYLLDSDAVFSNEEAAESALTGMFNQLFNTSFSGGGAQSVSYLGALSADNFMITSSSQDIIEFHQNNIIPINNYNSALWSGSYNIIYQANALLEGVKDNNSLTSGLVSRIEGSARFVRAFTYFYLTNLYGDVPLILSTDYEKNALAANTGQNLIYDQILIDLELAAELLKPTYPDGERTQLTNYAALSMLARVHLFLKNWQKARDYSSIVIGAKEQYELLEDLNQVFLANSKEAIWQISPIGWGNSFSHTRDGSLLIKTPTENTPVAFSPDFLNIFGDTDYRAKDWINDIVINNDTLFYPFKYKIQYDASGDIQEYSMVLRLSEQYLIRAEASARMGDLPGAIEDINTIRERAGISLIQNISTRDEILDLIKMERRKELFTEWGHRWLTLKRINESAPLEDKQGSNFSSNSWLYPIPSSERMKNPNLSQNPGY